MLVYISIRGIKFLTPLMILSLWNTADGFTPDFRHCVLLGFTGPITQLWFDSCAAFDYFTGTRTNSALND